MSNNFGFIKKLRSKESKDLKRNHTAAFLILDTIAENARWDTSPCRFGLEMGEAIITAAECGVSSQQFETGLKYLESMNYIKVVHRGRKDKNSELLPRIKPESTPDSILINKQNKPRINGTVAKLLDCCIYDINIKSTPNHIPNQNPNQTRINSGKTPNKQEAKKKNIQEQQQQQTSGVVVSLNEYRNGLDHIRDLIKKDEEREAAKVCNSDVDNSDISAQNEENIKISDTKDNITYNINQKNETKLNKNEYLVKKRILNLLKNAPRKYTPLTDEEKNFVMRAKFGKDEERVSLALKFFETEKVNKTLARGLYWHCNENIPPKPNTKIKPSYKEFIENKKIAENIEQNFRSRFAQVCVCYKAIEFYTSGQGAVPTVIEFDSCEFKEKVEEAKRRFIFEPTAAMA